MSIGQHAGLRSLVQLRCVLLAHVRDVTAAFRSNRHSWSCQIRADTLNFIIGDSLQAMLTAVHNTAHWNVRHPSSLRSSVILVHVPWSNAVFPR